MSHVPVTALGPLESVLAGLALLRDAELAQLIDRKVAEAIIKQARILFAGCSMTERKGTWWTPKKD